MIKSGPEKYCNKISYKGKKKIFKKKSENTHLESGARRQRDQAKERAKSIPNINKKYLFPILLQHHHSQNPYLWKNREKSTTNSSVTNMGKKKKNLSLFFHR